MDAKVFREHGHKLIEWVATYLEQAEKHPVMPNLEPGSIRKQLPSSAPEQAEPMQAIIRDFESIIMPGVTHWNHPRFFAYFPANHSGASILAELLSAALGVNGMVWQSCPAATELEEVVIDWLRKLIGLPDDFRGCIQDTASTASLCALICARERATHFQVNKQGAAAAVNPGPLRVYTSSQAHSSVEKGAKIAGFGSEHVVLVGVDEQLRLDPKDLNSRIEADLAAGKRPCCAVATVGTTSSTAIDPLVAIGEITRRHGLWLHVDAAMAGSAAILPEMRWLLHGVEAADSLVLNPHKWLLTNFDCSAFYVRDIALLTRTFSILPEYLKTSQDDTATNYRDWGIALGRRFRALKLWFVLRYYGAEGLRSLLRKHLALAQTFKGWVDQAPDFERLAPVPLQTICFRYKPAGRPDSELDALNEALLTAINKNGLTFLTHTRLREAYCLRMSIGQAATEAQHVEQAWNEIRTQAEGL